MKRILPKEITPDSVEKVVCEGMSKLRSVPMNDTQSHVLIAFLLSAESEEKSEELLKEIWTADTMIKRMKAQFGREIDPRVAIIIALGHNSIGSCILYGYYLHWKANQLGISGKITLTHFGENIFPFGMFSEEDIRNIWDSQKVYNRDEEFEGLEFSRGTDNLIDYGYASQSLHQKTEAQ